MSSTGPQWGIVGSNVDVNDRLLAALNICIISARVNHLIGKCRLTVSVHHIVITVLLVHQQRELFKKSINARH